MVIWYILGIMFFAWLTWKFVVKPILEDSGIEIEDKVTDYTIRLQKLQEEYDELTISAQAAEEGVKLLEQIRDLENKICEADEKMKEI